MTSKIFFACAAGILALLVLPFVAFNFLNDDFGLFWSDAPRRIWLQEKTSKYLMSYRYIPRNFDGLLIGPSYSDGSMDTRRLQGYRIYNLSMEGANATELKAATVNAIERGQMRVLIICLGPYITKNAGIKGNEINEKEYLGSLFSLLPLKLAETKFEDRRQPAHDMWAGSEWGSADLPRQTYSWDAFIRLAQSEPVESEIQINATAYRDLAAIIRAAHQHDVQIFAYYFPYNVWAVQTAVESGDWSRYQTRTNALFDLKRDVVWDMNAPDYDSLRQDVSCYSDGHLSKSGISLVLADIQRRLDENRLHRSLTSVFPRSEHLPCLGTLGAGSGFDRNSKLADAGTH